MLSRAEQPAQVVGFLKLETSQDDVIGKKVNKQFRSLKSFPVKVISSTPELQSLLLDFNQITSIPADEISKYATKLNSLQLFSISYNKLTSLPAELGLLTSLQILNASSNNLTSFDGSFLTCLQNLQELYLNSTYISTLPDMRDLTNLKGLSLSNCQLHTFFHDNPQYLFPSSLQSINLSYNNLSICPNLSSVLSTITKLDLTSNKLKELPLELAVMPSLTYLSIACNHLSSFPSGFGAGWSQLEVLNMEFNDFTTLPSELRALTRLRKLDLSGNGFQFEVPPRSLRQLVATLNAGEDNNSADETDIKMDILNKDEHPDEILPNLYLGNLWCARDKHALRRKGITHILTVANICAFHPQEFLYEIVDIDDDPSEDIIIHFEKSLNFIDTALSSGGKILVHCHAGVSRSATVVIAHVMKQKGFSVDECIKFVKERRPKIKPNSGFLKQLYDWESINRAQSLI